MDSEDNNEYQKKKLQPIEVTSKGHVQTDPDLVAEFNSNIGDIKVVCQGGVVIHCHACVLTYQSNVMRSLLKHTGDGFECTKYSSSTMMKFLQMMYSIKVVFTCHNEMFEVLMAAVYYNVKWLSVEVQAAIKDYCTGDDYEPTNANNCRDALLVLQENITYSAERPNPGYQPYDQSIQPLTEQLIRHLKDHCFSEGIVLIDIDTVAVVNTIYDYLDMDVKVRQIDNKGPITNLLGLCYDEANMNRSDIFNAVIRRDAVLSKLLLKTECASQRATYRRTVKRLNSSQAQLGQKYDQEVAGLKEKLKTTTEQLRAERQKERRNGHWGSSADRDW